MRDIASPLHGKISVKKLVEIVEYPKFLPELREIQPEERKGEVVTLVDVLNAMVLTVC